MRPPLRPPYARAQRVLRSSRLRGVRRTSPASSYSPAEKHPPLPTPIPRGSKTPEVGPRRARPCRRVPRPRGRRGEATRASEAANEGALLSPILRSPTLPPPPKIGAGGRSRRGDLEGGGQAAGRAGRGDGWTWTGNWKAKVWALNVRLHASQDQKRAQEIQRQPRGKEGTPGRPLFVCGSLSSSVRRK